MDAQAPFSAQGENGGTDRNMVARGPTGPLGVRGSDAQRGRGRHSSCATPPKLHSCNLQQQHSLQRPRVKAARRWRLMTVFRAQFYRSVAVRTRP